MTFHQAKGLRPIRRSTLNRVSALGVALMLACAPALAAAPAEKPVGTTVAPAAAPAGLSVAKIDFKRGDDGASRLIVQFDGQGAIPDLRTQGNSVVVDVGTARLPANLQKPLNVVDFATPVQRIDAKPSGAGTQLVLIDHPDQSDEQLLYLPALQRVNRIAGKARKGSFMGSDYAYEDLEVSGLDDAQHTLVREDDQLWVIDSVPGGDSSYSRIRSHVSKADKVPRIIEFFDAKGEALKVLRVSKTERDGDVVLPTVSEMENLKKGTRTRLEVLEHKLDVPAEEIPDETFTAAFMERSG